MRKLNIAARLAACACFALTAAAHAQAKEWRRIVPLRTTRAEVERRLGKPRGGYHELKTERAFIFYSGGRGCAGGEAWDVPRDTVVRILVTPKARLRLSSLRLDPRRFEKSADPEVPSHALYRDREAGLTYEVFEGGGKLNGLVLHIEFEPAAKDDERLRCPAPADGRPSGARRHDVERDGDVVADAPAEDEEVPDGVAVRHPLRGEEEDARRVGHAPGRNPQERPRRHGREYRPGGDDAEPAEHHV